MSNQDRVRKVFGGGERDGWLAFDDRLELLGVAAGLFVVLVGVGTLAGVPWHQSDLAVTVGRVLGTLATITVGVGIVWLVRQ